MPGPLGDQPRDDEQLSNPSAGQDAVPALDQQALLAEFRSRVGHEELELRAAVVMFCNNASDAYQSLTPDELDECREVEKVRDYLHAPGFRGNDPLKERFLSARQIIQEEADAYLGDPETVDHLITFLDSHLLAESASSVMSEVIMAHVRTMNAHLEEQIMQPFLEGINERMGDGVAFVDPADEREGDAELKPLRDWVETGRRALGAALKEHLRLKVELDSLVEEAMTIFATDFCSSCHVDDDYLVSTRENLEVAFRKPFEEALVNSYTTRYGQIMQTLIGIGALQPSDKITPLLEENG